jgi:tetratricopeptide (TPR) repeat protein
VLVIRVGLCDGDSEDVGLGAVYAHGNGQQIRRYESRWRLPGRAIRQAADSAVPAGLPSADTLARVFSGVLLWWSARQGLVRQARPARRVGLAQRAANARRDVGGRRMARALLVLADREIENGEAADAQTHAREALQLSADPVTVGDAHRVLARTLRVLGLQREAAESARAATEVYRTVPLSRSMVGRLANALEHHSACLEALGLYDEALRLAEQSHDLALRAPLRGNLVATRAGGATMAGRVDWRVEVRLTGLLWRAGRYAEAVTLGKEAQWFVTVIARLHPAQSGPWRFELLWYLAQAHHALAHLDQALAASEMAVAQARRLGPALRSNLAAALELHGAYLVLSGQAGEGDRVRREAQQVYLSLDDRIGLDRAASARVEGCWAAGDREGAIAIAVDYLPALRASVAADPGRFRPRLARELTLLGVRLVISGHEGMPCVDEGVAVARDCDSTTLAWCLRRRAIVLRDAAEADAALRDATEAAHLLEGGADDDERLRALILAAQIESNQGHHEASLRYRLKAMEVAERKSEDDPLRLWVLDGLGWCYLTLRRRDEAFEILGQTIALGRRTQSSVDRDQVLANALRRRSLVLTALQRTGEARDDIAEAITHIQRLVDADPDRFSPVLTRARDEQERLAQKMNPTQ